MKVIVADSAGFCFGVKRAVDEVYRQIETGLKPVYTYGPVIHNEQVMEKLEKKGVRVIRGEEELSDVSGGTIIIRAHGIGRDLEEKLRKTGCGIVDATCPPDGGDGLIDPRGWYYALLDYGAYLKKTVPNPSRRSAHHARQSRFEGSHRQKRSFILRLLLDAQGVGALDVAQVAAALGAYEQRATRPAPSFDEVRGILDELARDGMAQESDQGLWTVTDR